MPRGAVEQWPLVAKGWSTLVLYEYPFNESIRTMLRLEHLFDRLGQLMARDTALDHHFALATIFEVMDVASRADLKSDLLKELERHRTQFNSYRGNPAVSEAVLDEVVGRIDVACSGCCATAAHRTRSRRTRASTSKACRRAAASNCCACASIRAWAWCPRSAATG